MVTLTIKQLEKNLGYKIKRNIYCMAIDTATKSGIAIIKVNKKVQINAFVFGITDKIIREINKKYKSKIEKYQAKLEIFYQVVRDEILPYTNKMGNPKIKMLLLENSFLKFNPVTFGFLRALQGIIFASLYEKFDKRLIIFPITARKLVGFHSRLSKRATGKQKKQEIMTWIGNIIGQKIEDDNIADALLLGFAGIKE